MASIQKRANGKWRARYRDAEDKEHARHFTLKRDAEQWLATVTASVVRGDYVDPKAGMVTFSQFYKSWSARQVWTHGSRDSFDLIGYGSTFGNVPLLKIKRSHVETWIKTMTNAGLAPQTIGNRLGLARSVFTAAIGDQLIAVDPTRGVKKPRKRHREFTMRIPTGEEVNALLNAADPYFRPAIIMGAFAGLRQGEIAGLQLPDFDFLGRQVYVQRQVQRRSPHPIEIRAPKYNSERVIFLPQSVLTEVSKHLQEFGTYGEDQWLLMGKDGGPIWPRQFGYRFEAAATKAGLDVSSHDLRHFFASGLIAAGCDVVTVQRAMGHKSASVTLDTYSHLWPSAEDRTRNAIESVFAETLADPVRTAESQTGTDLH
ncbi:MULTISPECIES: site-specific integrase [Brevibacterium]|uniref:Site-specific recombinase XerD n=1 Tax=Brevibacterium antiquum CNRZ 918 TaxID=1255637 RepID=A0A2H1KWF1_9MICO|nr:MULTISPECIES: site-specific integrase [Brevibacterium]SMY04105.1 Site-specific recombinase XerD [Brevibacterium antiquum CNRZ 918]